MESISLLEIRRIMKIEDVVFPDFNNLLDEGTVWDADYGAVFLQNQDNALFVATWEGELAGFLTAHRLQRFDQRKAEVLLYEIGVAEQFRHRGIGKALVDEVKIWAKTVGADEVWVQTNRSNQAAVALYRSCGGVEDSHDTTMYTIAIK